jgi:hypothetical protein
LQNTGLPLRDAELARQRDFDELFFFAGASEESIKNFLAESSARNLQLRPNGVLWSLALDASTGRCIRELTKLYDRSLRYHPQTLAIATPDLAADLFPHCERRIGGGFCLARFPSRPGNSPSFCGRVGKGPRSSGR